MSSLSATATVKHNTKAVKEALKNNCFVPYLAQTGYTDKLRIRDVKTVKGVLKVYCNVLGSMTWLDVSDACVITQM